MGLYLATSVGSPALKIGVMTADFQSSGNTASIIDRLTRRVTGEHRVLEFSSGGRSHTHPVTEYLRFSLSPAQAEYLYCRS